MKLLKISCCPLIWNIPSVEVWCVQGVVCSVQLVTVMETAGVQRSSAGDQSTSVTPGTHTAPCTSNTLHRLGGPEVCSEPGQWSHLVNSEWSKVTWLPTREICKLELVKQLKCKKLEGKMMHQWCNYSVTGFQWILPTVWSEGWLQQQQASSSWSRNPRAAVAV